MLDGTRAPAGYASVLTLLADVIEEDACDAAKRTNTERTPLDTVEEAA
jgi:hypothetical protein